MVMCELVTKSKKKKFISDFTAKLCGFVLYLHP